MFEDETGKLSGNSSDNSEEPEKGDLYHTEYVDLIYSAIAYPAERGVSDFNCRIALTNWHLYVTQELDSGRLADRYILDINDIEEVKISNPYMTSVDTDRCAASLPIIMTSKRRASSMKRRSAGTRSRSRAIWARAVRHLP